jgi:hypothetical protein
MDDKELTKAKYLEWQASLFGACFIAVSLGVWLSDYLRPYSILILIVGIILHSWGMYKIHQRNK